MAIVHGSFSSASIGLQTTLRGKKMREQHKNTAIAMRISFPMYPTVVDGEWYVKTREKLFVLRLNQDEDAPVWALCGFYC
jgi:hypothetical protein